MEIFPRFAFGPVRDFVHLWFDLCVSTFDHFGLLFWPLIGIGLSIGLFSVLTSGVFVVIPADPKFQIRKFYFCWLCLILEIGLILNPFSFTQVTMRIESVRELANHGWPWLLLLQRTRNWSRRTYQGHKGPQVCQTQSLYWSVFNLNVVECG